MLGRCIVAGLCDSEAMKTAAERYGVSEQDWDRQVFAATRSLERIAALGRVTSYTDLNREIAEKTGLDQFNFAHPEGRNALAWILGEVVDRTVDDLQSMLSAVVLYIDGNDAGLGFYHLAVQLTGEGRLDPGLSADASSDDKLRFWSDQVAAVHEACKGKGAAGRRRRI